MEGRNSVFIQNLVPKVEPDDPEFVLCGEFVDNVPTPSHESSTHIENHNGSQQENVIEENPLTFQDFKVMVKDCMLDLANIKADVKSEPEEDVYDDSQETSYQSNDEQNVKPQINTDSVKPKRNRKKRAPWVPQRTTDMVPENILSPAVKRKRTTHNYTVDNASESDHDGSYSPKRAMNSSASRDRSSAKKGKSSKAKKTPRRDLNKEKQSNDLSDKNDSESETPATVSLSVSKSPSKKKKKDSVEHEYSNDLSDKNDSESETPATVSLTVSKSPSKKKKKGSVEHEPETITSLWSCCEVEFEQFSAFNNHKVQKHKIEELRCSVCEENLLPSMDDLEKHYLDVHLAKTSSTSFHCAPCHLVFGVKSSFFDHKEKCCESQNVGSEILESTLGLADTRETSQQAAKVNEDTAFRLSCCGKIMNNFAEFFLHKQSDHKIALLTCGLCLAVKETEVKLRTHYKKFHYSRFLDQLDLKHGHSVEDEDEVEAASNSQQDYDEGFNSEGDDDVTKTDQDKCSALQDGILCRCVTCTKVISQMKPSSSNGEANNDFGRVGSNIPKNKSQKELISCSLCNKHFKRKINLANHYKTHSGIKDFPCEICGKAYTAEYTLKTHKIAAHSTASISKPKNVCSICNLSFIAKNSLKRHINDVHFKRIRSLPLSCKCGKTFAYKTGLDRHFKKKHGRQETFQCEHCSKVFFEKHDIVNHMQRFHLPSEKYTCEICNVVFLSKVGFNKHIQYKHSAVEYQFCCEVCGKGFTRKSSLEKHMPTHSDDKPFVCQACGKAFKREENLQQHQYTHSDSRPHACGICGQTFRLRTHVKQHMAVHGFERKHKCFMCNKAFARKTDLKSHLITHGV